MNGLWIVMMFWMLSNVGGLSGIITALGAVMFLLFEEPFRLVCDCDKHPEHAWPFQFHPVIVRECDGYEKQE